MIDSYSSYVVLFGFYTQQNVNSAANFVFTSKIGLPRVVPVLRWVLFLRQIFVAPHLEFEQHMHSSDPKPDTVSLTQLESRGVVPQASQPPSKASTKTFLNLIPQLEGRKVKNHRRLRHHAFFFSFPWFSITDQEAVRRSAALLLRIKDLALQKRPLFVLFALAGIIAAILDVAMLCAVEGVRCGNYLKSTEAHSFDCCFLSQNNHLALTISNR